MFLSRKIDIKLCQNYAKTYIYQILYKIRSIQQLRNQTENGDIPEKPMRILDLLLL